MKTRGIAVTVAPLTLDESRDTGYFGSGHQPPPCAMGFQAPRGCRRA